MVHTHQVCESKQVMGAVSDHTRWDQVGEKLISRINDDVCFKNVGEKEAIVISDQKWWQFVSFFSA